MSERSTAGRIVRTGARWTLWLAAAAVIGVAGCGPAPDAISTHQQAYMLGAWDIEDNATDCNALVLMGDPYGYARPGQPESCYHKVGDSGDTSIGLAGQGFHYAGNNLINNPAYSSDPRYDPKGNYRYRCADGSEWWLGYDTSAGCPGNGEITMLTWYWRDNN